jgi:glycine dehydrogenase
MIEPTESESLEQLDRVVDAMICIYQEIKEIEQGLVDPADNVLLQAPHAMYELTADTWPHAYSRQKAGYPLPWLTENKFQLPVGRIDNAYGDRHLCCEWTV